MPEFLKSARYARTNVRAAPSASPATSFVIAPPPARVVSSAGPRPVQQPANLRGYGDFGASREEVVSLMRQVQELSRALAQAQQDILTLAANTEANLGALDKQLRNQGEAITALTRGVVETFAPRQTTVPGASRRTAKIATRRGASASQAVVDVTPGEASSGEPTVEKALEAYYGLQED